MKFKRIRLKKKINSNQKNINFFAINCAGIKSKLKSFETVLTDLKPTVWMVQETKLKPHETIASGSLSEYQVYYLNRQSSQGGGVALGVNKNLASTLVNEGDGDVETLSVKLFLDKLALRIVTAYGPQENDLKDKKNKFWEFLEKEVNCAELEEEGIIIQMDGNLHAGPSLVKNDPNKINQNGKLFLEFLDRNKQLSVVNTLDICQGIITRSRIVEDKTERAVLDFFVVNEKVLPLINKMIIDEDKNFSLMNLAQIKKNKRFVESDHNALILELEIKEDEEKPKREEIFNFRSKIGQETFQRETEKNQNLLDCFDNNKPIEIQIEKWKDSFENILKKCFKKIRITPKKTITKTEDLLRERVELKREERKAEIDENMKQVIKQRIAVIEDSIADDVIHENFKIITETQKEISKDGNINGSGRKKMWSVLKNKFPKISLPTPIAKKDNKGNLITRHEDLKSLYLKTYKQRMRNRPIKEQLSDFKWLKENLFDMRLKLAGEKKSEFWTMEQLEKVLKALKSKKSRDPNGWINELFHNGVAGSNLKISLLHIFNKIKEENHIPDFVRLADVSTIYKGKGSKKELLNERGIFIVPILRNILMRLIYQDYYSILDKSMSDSQIGARKGKNIRNHLWIVHGIISDALSSKSKKPIDIQIYDYKQCFDSLWLQDCMNDFYSAGLQDDKFSLLYNINSNVNIAVRTPVGKTARASINNAITQGDVFGAMFCSKSVDTFGQECIEESRYTYIYRGEVEIPPLSMVDDLLCVSECGFKTKSVNAYITFKTDSKKLQFGAQKCKKLHVGKSKQNFKCQNLEVDYWKEFEVLNKETGEEEIIDVCDEKDKMEEKQDERYLGDIISVDGRNIRNIKARVSKARGIISRILSILDGIPFGQYYFEVALILRGSLLISSLLCNSESWYNVTKTELDLLESVDLHFLRQILNVPKSTPKEMLFLEMGCLPLRHMIRKRRIMFLHYILNQDSNSMLYRFLMIQNKSRKKKDWIVQVMTDLKELEMDENFEDIKNLKKLKLRKILDNKIKDNVFKELIKQKENHSKVRNLQYDQFEMQNYLRPCKIQIRKEEAQEIFKLRSRVSNVKNNYKGKYETLECEICDNNEEESQKHILQCIKLNEKSEEIPEYEQIFYGNVKMKLAIARKFIENLKTRDKINNSKG